MICRRIVELATSTRVASLQYNIRSPPSPNDVQWSKLTTENFIQYLTLKTNPYKAIRFWIVGEITPDGAWLMRSDGGPTIPLVNLRVEPVVIGELHMWREYLLSHGGWQGESCRWFPLIH